MLDRLLTSAIIVSLFAGVISANSAEAICKGSPINPVTDTCWSCMFPARFGGYQFGRSDDVAPGETESPICGCANGTGITMGFSVGFWEHARLIETVKDPWCMPALGAGLNDGGSLSALMSGSHRTQVSGGTESDYASQQTHYYVYPIWMLLNLFSDFPCIEKDPFDLIYMTEVDPTWNDDALSFILNPEALLFGNPITQLACMADTIAATSQAPLDALFWCQGAAGSSYPLTGSTTVTNPMNLNAGMASRMLFKLSRENLLYDTAINNCAQRGVLQPIYVKSHYRLQIAKPRRGQDCVPIGRPDFLWGSGKNPPMGAGNNSPDKFLWLLTRARTCCVGYTFR